MYRTLGVACVVGSLFGTARLHAQQFSLVVDALATAQPYSATVGTRRVFICRPNLQLQPIWGTDVYTDDSPICSAAVHAGVITQAQGGVVTIVIGEGRATYTGSKRNGVESTNWADNGRSYTLDGTAIGEIDWGTSVAGLPRGFDTPLNLLCPPSSATVVAEVAAIYGSDIYSDDSPICVAALHAGLITLAGGTVGFASRGAQPSFAATARNSVTSRAFGAWGASFSVSPGPQSLSRSAPIASTTTLTPPADPPPQPLQPTTINRTPTVIAGPSALWAYAFTSREGSIRLTWTPVDGATAYRVTRVRNTGDPETTIIQDAVSAFATWEYGYGGVTCDAQAAIRNPSAADTAYCQYLDSDMTSGTTYSYRVYALFSNGVVSAPSPAVTIKTLKP